jgi:hypothetical protein
LSETKLSTKDLKGWLEEQTRTILNPVQEDAKELLEEMRKALETEKEACTMLLDNSNREIENRNMRVYGRARALNKLARLFLDRLKKITIPNQVSYDLLNRFAQDTQRVFIVADVDIKNWFPRISPFFIIDRRKYLAVHEKAKLTLGMLNDFITKEYVKTKTIEETLQLIDDVQDLERQLNEVETQKANMQTEKAPIEKEIADLRAKIAELETKGPIDELNLIETEKEALTNELKHALSHLQKPFLKMQALATSGGGAGLTPDEVKVLTGYMDNPLETFADEPQGYPTLKEILQKLVSLMDENKLKLKSDKARKAAQSTEEILMKNSLVELQTRVISLVGRRNQLLTSNKMDETKRDLALCQDQLKQLMARKTSVETHEAVKGQTETEIREKISANKRIIEKNVLSFLGKKIAVQ